METSLLRLFLQTLCHGSPWNYAVFWKFQQGRDLLLTWEDGYCDIPTVAGSMGSIAEDVYSKSSDKLSTSTFESSSGFAVYEMSNSRYTFGKGIIGEVASSGMPLWLYSDHILADGYSSSLMTQCPDEWFPQFAAGIKTILLIPSIPDGVLQLGSLQTVDEDAELVAIVRDMLGAHQELAKNPSQFLLSGETHHALTTPCHVENMMMSYSNTGSCIIGNPEVIDYVVAKEDLPSITHHGFQNKENTLNTEMHNSPNMNKIDAVAVYGDNSTDIMQYYLGGSGSFPTDGYTMSTDQRTDNLLNFPNYSELHEALGLHIIDHGQFKPDSSNTGAIAVNSLDIAGNISYNTVTPSSDPDERIIGGGGNEKNILKAASNEMALNSKKRKHLADSMENVGNKKITISLEDSNPWSSFTSASRDQDNRTNSLLSPASCMTTEYLQQEKECNFVYDEKELKPPSNKKRRAVSTRNQKCRPRDRQLLQDRLRELRELVPDGRKCSIDGLLDKTAKHLVFLKGVADRSAKLREQSMIELPAEGTRAGMESKQNGMSWAIELGGGEKLCPIIVKDLKIPRHMLIQMACDGFERFLEITEVIHQLDLTVLRGVLDQQSDCRLANFIVEAPEKLHRLDIFWPLMQLVQTSVAVRNQI